MGRKEEVWETLQEEFSEWDERSLPPALDEIATKAGTSENTTRKWVDKLEEEDKIDTKEFDKRRIAPNGFNWKKLETENITEIKEKLRRALSKEIEYETVKVEGDNESEIMEVPVSLENLARKWKNREFGDIPEKVAREVGTYAESDDFKEKFYSIDQEVAKEVAMDAAHIERLEIKIKEIFEDKVDLPSRIRHRIDNL